MYSVKDVEKELIAFFLVSIKKESLRTIKLPSDIRGSLINGHDGGNLSPTDMMYV